MSLTKVTYSMIEGAEFNVLDYDADPTNTADSTTAIQAAIDAAQAVGGCVVIPAGTYKCTSNLRIDVSGKSIEVKGLGPPLLDFTSAVGAIDCLTVNSNATVLSNFNLNGNNLTTGLRVNDVGSSINTARCSFSNLRIGNHGIALRSIYYTSSVINNCELASSNLGWQSGTQNNNLACVGMRFVNCGQFATFQTSEGISFVAPQLQNITNVGTAYAISLRQSTITMTDPYWENLSNANVALIGGPTDGIGCTFISFGGIYEGGKSVFYREPLNHVIQINGARNTGGGTERVGIANLSTNGYWLLRSGQLNNINDDVPSYVSVVDQYDFSFSKPIGNFNIINRYRDYIEINRTGGGTYNLLGLTAGDPYTIVLAVRLVAGTVIAVRFRDGSGVIVQTLNLVNTNMPTTLDEFSLLYLPFFAFNVQLQLLFPDALTQLKYLAVYNGHVFPDVDINSVRPLRYSAAPTVGTWFQGDFVSNSAATIGQPKGFLCTVAGTPGTWVSTGNL